MNNVSDGFMLALGIAAGVLTSISLMPQVAKMIKTKKAEQISPWMNIVLITGQILWIVYGIIKKDSPIIFTNAFSVMLSVFMLFLRRKYKGND